MFGGERAIVKFETFYSSSRANLYTVTAADGRRLMLECGIRWQLLQKALNHRLDNLEACLISHEHL
jgi:hypothetical protein